MPMNKNYTEFTALDFAQDPAFIRWVRYPDKESMPFWEGWLTVHPEKRPVLEEAKRLVLAIKVQESEPSPETLQRIWGNIDAATQSQDKPVRRLAVLRLLPYVAAASVAFLLFFIFRDPTKVVLTENAQQLALNLPDGSKVKVNAATEIRYTPGKWKKERRIQLDGEAFFEVAKGESFVVETKLGNVEVLGTSFNVKSRDGIFEVSCRTGKVRVSSGASRQVLTPGLSTRLMGGTTLENPSPSDPDMAAGWRNGRFYFRDATLQVVFSELSRQYDIEVQARPEVLKRKTTTFFEAGNLDSALYKVCWPMQLNATRSGNLVVVE